MNSTHKLPLIDLHCHFEGAINSSIAFSVLHSINHPSARTWNQFNNLVRDYDSGWNNFDYAIDLLGECLIDSSITEEIAYDFVKRAGEDNVLILEPIICPSIFRPKTSERLQCRELYDSYLESIFVGMNRASKEYGIELAPRLLISPFHFSQSFNDNFGSIYSLISRFQHFIGGVDLCTLDHWIIGSKYNLDELREFCGFIRSSKLKISAHAGEFGNSSAMQLALSLSVDRIGHGIQCIDDQNLLHTLREQQIVLEVCPTSNLRTLAASNLDPHFLKRLIQNGLKITINSDDPTVLSTTMSKELCLAMKQHQLTHCEIRQCLANAFAASFLSDERKAMLHGVFSNALLESCDLFES